MKIVLCTGGYDPLHSGHIAYLKAARTLGDMLIVGLNSDEWLERKKGRAFMPWNERLCVINNLSMIDEVYTFDDSDGSAKAFIHQVRAHYPDAELIFANGGDRTAKNIPEMDVQDSNLKFEFEVGGNTKKNSSSWILSNWVNQNSQNRFWGSFKTLYTDGDRIKVKELSLEPEKSISLQKHQQRNEFWVVVSGIAKVQIDNTESILKSQDYIHIKPNTLHKLTNIGNDTLKILEVQHGTKCDESDIERFDT